LILYICFPEQESGLLLAEPTTSILGQVIWAFSLLGRPLTLSATADLFCVTGQLLSLFKQQTWTKYAEWNCPYSDNTRNAVDIRIVRGMKFSVLGQYAEWTKIRISGRIRSQNRKHFKCLIRSWGGFFSQTSLQQNKYHASATLKMNVHIIVADCCVPIYLLHIQPRLCLRY
jgi:hypothetical protein